MIGFKVFVTAIWYGKTVDMNWHWLSPFVLQANGLTKCASHPAFLVAQRGCESKSWKEIFLILSRRKKQERKKSTRLN